MLFKNIKSFVYNKIKICGAFLKENNTKIIIYLESKGLR